MPRYSENVVAALRKVVSSSDLGTISIAGVEDTGYPYYHVSDHPDTPSLGSHTDSIHNDPSGLYLFFKGKPVDQTDWKPKKYRWDAKLKTAPDDVTDLDYNELLKKAGITDIEAFIEELSNKYDMSSIDHDYGNWLEEEEEEEDAFLWSDIGYPLLRYRFNDRDKFANFLKSQGVKAISDPQGFTIFYGEPQVIVLDPSIIEWGEREENVADNKVYVMAALRKITAEEIKAKGPTWVKPTVKEMVEEFRFEELGAYDWITSEGQDEEPLVAVVKEGSVYTLRHDDIRKAFQNLEESDFEVPDNWLDPETPEEDGLRYNPEHHDDLIPAMLNGGQVTMPLIYRDGYDEYTVVSGRHRINYAYQLGIPLKIFIPDDLGKVVEDYLKS